MVSRERDLELRFLECGVERATQWHNGPHTKRKEWNCFEVITPEAMYTATRLRKESDPNMMLLDSLISKDPALVDALSVFLITELGITYYPEEVGGIFNPLKLPPNDNDPHNLFGRVWPSEEYQHALVQMRVLEVLGLDLVALENLRKKFIIAGVIPRFDWIFDGVAYTAPQEANTASPYQELIKRLKSMFDDPKFPEREGVEQGSEAGILLESCIEAYRLVAQDERLHKLYIAGEAYDGLHSGDPEIAGAMMVAIQKRFVDEAFYMPGKNMEGFKRKALAISKAGIFTVKHVRRSKLSLLDDWAINKVSDLNGAGYEAQQKIIHFLHEQQALELEYVR